MLQFFMIMTKSKQQVRPDSLLQGTWSNLYLCWGLCLLCFGFVFRFIDFWDCWHFFIVIFTKLSLFLSWTYLLLLVNKEDTFRRKNKLSFPPLWIAIFFYLLLFAWRSAYFIGLSALHGILTNDKARKYISSVVLVEVYRINLGR